MKTSQFRLSLDTTGFRRSANQAERDLKGIGDTARREGEGISVLSNRLKVGIASALSVTAVVAFAKSLTNVRAGMAQLEVAIATFLGSKERADELIRDVQTFAVTTPFSLQETTQATQALLGYGIEAEKIGATLEQLGNVASGTGNSLNDLVAPFGRIIAINRVATRELETFARRGVPIFDELARVLGVSSDAIGEMATNSQLSRDDIVRAFEGMSAAGGRYAGLTDVLQDEIVGLQDSLSGGIERLQLDLGRKLEPAIKSTYRAGIYLVDNFKEIAEIIATLITTYGVYRAALVAHAAIQRQIVLVQRAAAISGGQLTASQTAGAIASRAWSVALGGLRRSIMALWTSMAANPLGLLVAAIGAATYGVYRLVSADDLATAATKRYNESVEELNEATDERIAKANALISLTQDNAAADLARSGALDELISKYPAIIQGYIDEEGKLRNIVELKREIADLERREIRSQRTDRLERVEGEIQRQESLYTRATTTSTRNAIKSQLEGLYAVREAILSEIRNETIQKEEKEWQISLKKLSESQLETEIKELKNRHYKAAEEEKAAIQTRIDVVNAELRAREATEIRKNYAYWEELEAELISEQRSLDAETDVGGTRWTELEQQIIHAREQLAKYTIKVEEAKDKEEEFLDLLTRIEQTRYEISRTGVEDRLELNELGRKNELQKLEKDIRDRAYSEEQYLTLKEETNKLYDQRAKVISDDESHREAERWKEALERFKTKESQILDIKEEYSKLRVQAEKDSSIDIEKINKEEAEKISSIVREAIDLDALTLFGELDRLSDRALRDIRDKLKGQLLTVGLELEPSDQKALVDALERFEAKITERNPFEGVKVGAVEYKDALLELKEAQDALRLAEQVNDLAAIEEAENEIASALDKQANALYNLSNALNEAGRRGNEISGIVSGVLGIFNELGVNIPKEIDGIVSGFSDIFGALESIDLTKPFSVVSSAVGILSGAVKIGKGLFDGVKGIFGSSRKARRENERMLEVLRLQTEEMNRQYLLAQAQADIDRASTIFGTDSWQAMRKTAELYEKLLRQSNKSLNELSDARVVTGTYVSRSFWRSKRKDRWEGLLEAYPELIDANGQLNIELAESISNTQKLDDESKRLLENAIRDAKELEEALETLRDGLRDIFGEFGDDITDAFIRAFREGTDAMEDMYSSASNMIETLARKMISSFIFTKYLQSYVDEIEKLALDTGLSDEEAFSEVNRIISKALSKAAGAGGLITELIESLQKEAEKWGFNIFTESEEGQKIGGYQTLSEDTGNRLEGINRAISTNVAFIRGDMARVGDSLVSMRGFSERTATNTFELRNISLNAVGYLDRIAKGTDNLHEMRQDINSLMVVVRDRL